MTSSKIEGLPAEEILVLGSMPSTASLRAKEYYANPSNAFWFVMENLFGASREKPYRERIAILLDRKIAVWDVLERCTREGSLDADIKDGKLNDFPDFFGTHPQLKAVFFNGKLAERSFKRSEPPLTRAEGLQHFLLPSTSAALARPPAQKLESWRSAFLKIGVPVL